MVYDSTSREVIPKNDLIAGKRKLQVKFEAKAVNAEYGLRFVLKRDPDGYWLANQKIAITKNEWIPASLYFQVAPTENFSIAIYNEKVSNAPSSIQFRNLVITERKA